MKCIYCGNETQVVNSRPQRSVNHIWRRRHCLLCGSVFTTTESADLSASMVVKSSSGLLPFKRDILYLSIHRSILHRPEAVDEADALCRTIIAKLFPQFQKAVVGTEHIKDVVRETLEQFDHAAAVSYDAFHPNAKKQVSGNKR